ncbi:MAG: recombination mediator RecR [Desulfohalobiaceae bacterium]|nr:recombination mediator RecR [Desulfohalobiaceae bacterium]
MEKLPHALRAVVDQFSRLPGLGPKSALRIALILLQQPEDRTRNLGNAILRLRESLTLCSQCGSISETDPCVICSDARRSEDRLCLVADWDALLTIDEAGFYQGKYLVLGGLLSPLNGVQSGQLATNLLKKRLDSGLIREVILALGTTRDSEATESYISNLIREQYPEVRITRLAQGIPIGAQLKHMDRETLKQSLNYRQEL